MAVGRSLGLEVREPRVLSDTSKVVTHLAPEPVVARVTLVSPNDTATRAVHRELDVAAFLDREGANVAAPVKSMHAGPYERDGFLVTLWQYVQHEGDDPLDAGLAGEALREIHQLLATYDGRELSHFARLAETRRLVLRLDLTASEKHLLSDALEAAGAITRELDAPLQPVHGDAHLKNILRTPSGPLWTDFEKACLAPREFDIACNEMRVRSVGRQPQDDAFLTGYGDYDRELVSLLIGVGVLPLAAWTLELAQRRPEFRLLAAQRMRWVRQSLGL
jgi:Ser/Thr protein kinase RdoA (MazF antagonist)